MDYYLKCDNQKCGCKTKCFQWCSDGAKVIYFESPKCCSTSIRIGLGIPPGTNSGGKYNFYNLRSSANIRDRRKGRGIGKLREGKRSHNWQKFKNQEKFDEYFKFGFVRNPWDRAVSTWEMYAAETLQRSRHHRTKDIFVEYFKKPRWEVTFIEFIKHIHIYNNHHWEHQHKFIPDCIDFLGRFESFDKDMEYILDKTGITTKIGKFNTSTGRKHYTEYYNDETRGIVAEIYKKDIEYFRYEYGDYKPQKRVQKYQENYELIFPNAFKPKWQEE